MKKFLNIIISVLVTIILLFTIFVGIIYIFVLFLVNFALCLPIVLVSFLFFKTKNKE